MDVFLQKSKASKSKVIHAIWESMCCSALTFVRKDKKTGDYVEINHRDARQKISHTIRYRRSQESPEKVSESSDASVISRVSQDNPMEPAAVDTSITATSSDVTEIFSDDELESVLPFAVRFEPPESLFTTVGASRVSEGSDQDSSPSAVVAKEKFDIDASTMKFFEMDFTEWQSW